MARNEPERDEEAWRSIVDNFGDRAELDDDLAGPADLPEPAPAYRFEPPAPEPEVADVDAFVPPDPPLPPRPTRDRQLAWAGLIGAPLLLLLLLVLGVRIPELLAYTLVAGLVGGFVYLVFHLPRNPDDPFDDGARV